MWPFLRIVYGMHERVRCWLFVNRQFFGISCG